MELKANESHWFYVIWHGQMKFELFTLLSQARFWNVSVLRQAALNPQQEDSLPTAAYWADWTLLKVRLYFLGSVF
jgi:hypothetical protein